MMKILLGITAFLLGCGLTLAFAPYEVFPLAVIAPAGLLALWLRSSAKQAFWLGFAFGLGLFGAGVYWVYISIHDIGHVAPLLAGLITCGMIAFLSLYPATVGYLLNRYFPINNSTKMLCAFPSLWVFSEIIRSWLFTGFPWLLLGYSQTNSPLRGFAPVFSVYGVSLALVITSALIVNAVIKYKQNDFRSTYQQLLAVTILWASGSLLSLIPWTQPQGQSIPVSLVQGNIPQTLKWSPEHLQLSFDTYVKLTDPLWSKDRLVIWPEAAIPVPLQDTTEFIDTMDAIALDNDAHLILGIPIQARDKSGYYNAIVTLGKEKKVYLKRLLVPFGEYTPFADLLNTFNFLHLPLPGGTARGNVTQDPLLIGKIKILPSICYEIAFPEFSRSTDKTIGLLLTLTNDAWFGKSIAQAQHLQMAEMRALEMKRPVLFVSNDGITAIIDSDGRVTAAAPPYQQYVLNGTVQPLYGLTPWMLNGDDPVAFIMICLLVTAVRAKRKIVKSSEPVYQAST